MPRVVYLVVAGFCAFCLYRFCKAKTSKAEGTWMLSYFAGGVFIAITAAMQF